ncbi:MAG TPA: beta-ketoacyl reductase, partial [Longimicrobiaceae bacterium]|nr:beta-ketoacyl reductase [Longimicrobiaceae bacterium]
LGATGGRGVDVVLNSLADEFIPGSLQCLAENGRFIELGKRGIWDPAQVAAVRPDASYFVVDLAAAAQHEPELIQELLCVVVAGIEKGALRPLPVKTFPMAEAIAAFRYMAQARHIGKIVLTHHPAPAIRPDATYLITGGLGGVGFSVAQWLVEQGARSLVLVGRSAPSEAARRVLTELESAGARVVARQADISRPEEVDALLEMMRRTLPPLRGVFHGALVLDDAALMQQSWARFESVFAPRVRGGWLLHTRTMGLPLDFFVLFSAAGALLGSPGQANYTAANAFLDALAHHRSRRGLPGLSVQWGLWGKVGRAAKMGVGERMIEQGIGTMEPRQALAALGAVMRQVHAPPQVAVMQVEWPTFLERAGPRRVSPFFSVLAAEARRPARATVGRAVAVPAEPRRSLRRELEEAPPTRRSTLLAAHVRGQVGRVLSLDAAHPLDPRQPLQELGLDSLMAVELRRLLGAGLDLSRGLPATLAFDYPTIEAITGFLSKEIFGAPPVASGASPNGEGAAEAAAHADLDELTDAEAEELLLAELQTIRVPNS